MKRDMELIRLLMLELEQGNKPEELANYSVKDVLYNLELMNDAGLILASFIKDSEGATRTAITQRLTWAGHDFLEATRDSKIWKKAQETVIKPGLSWTFQTLLEFLKREIERQLFGGGTPGP